MCVLQVFTTPNHRQTTSFNDNSIEAGIWITCITVIILIDLDYPLHPNSFHYFRSLRSCLIKLQVAQCQRRWAKAKHCPVTLTWTVWVQFLPAQTHETCLCCSAKNGLMKLVCLLSAKILEAVPSMLNFLILLSWSGRVGQAKLIWKTGPYKKSYITSAPDPGSWLDWVPTGGWASGLSIKH